VSFFHLTLEIAENNAEFLSESLYAQGALGQEWREPHLITMPGVDAPPPGKIHIVSFFNTLQDAENALQAAQTQWNARLIALASQEDTDWSTAWQKQIRATQTRHLWVGPPWLEPPPGKQVLYIEPKMAFGTGDHPTTRLCLEEIDAFCSAFPKATVLDVGTGTGILGMAACKLGALHALGTDNDFIALAHARENIALNHIDNMRVSDAKLHHIHERFELIVANIFANTLMDLAEALCKKTQKHLIISGILAPQSAALERRFAKLGMQLSAKRTFEEWVCLSFKTPKL
jgi:ribosomal protein L11 methyltransferase